MYKKVTKEEEKEKESSGRVERVVLAYSGGMGSGEGVFCGRIQLCWIRRATTAPCRMVVRENDGFSAAACSESLSCRSTKSATIPGVGVSDMAGEPLWKPPIASRALSVTDSCGVHVIRTYTRGNATDSETHEKCATIDLCPRLEDGDAQRAEPERVHGTLGCERVLDVIHRHGHAQPIFGRELGHIQSPARGVVQAPAHHVQIARWQAH